MARTLGTGFWQAMRIQAEESAPTALYTYDDVAFSKEKSPVGASFDLRVLLTDRRSGQAIPYAEVTSTISRNGKVVFSGRELGTITQTGMSDYETNVRLRGPGTYKLSVRVGSPLASRHLEDAPNDMWKLGQSHRLVSTFVWK